MFLTNNESIQEVVLFPQMKPEKKALELSDAEKTILNLMKTNNSMELGALKTAAELSGKQWDKGMKGLSKHGLIKVEVDGDAKRCVLQS
jgi:lysyl-tRNA synthetase class 2